MTAKAAPPDDARRRLRYPCPPMVTRVLPAPLLLAATLLLAACGDQATGPIAISAIGGEPRLANPSREPLDPPSAILLEAAAQGLVRFDAGGEIEPALAQRWIVSDDGLHYVFRLAHAEWRSGGRVTAEQVAVRLRAATSRSSRNPLKPVLGAVDEIVAMTDACSRSASRRRGPFLQLRAQPELRSDGGEGSGPIGRARRTDDRAVPLDIRRGGRKAAAVAAPRESAAVAAAPSR